MKNYELNVCMREVMWREVFNENYQLQLEPSFVENKQPKDHGLQNHVRWFVTQLKLNATPLQKQSLKKREIYVVNYGMNTGSEMNGDRPSIIYKSDNYTLGEDVIVIPMTSALREKLTDKFDVLIQKDEDNTLYQNSYARLRQCRAVSVKKLWKKVGALTNLDAIAAIDTGMKEMLGLE